MKNYVSPRRQNQNTKSFKGRLFNQNENLKSAELEGGESIQDPESSNHSSLVDGSKERLTELSHKLSGKIRNNPKTSVALVAAGIGTAVVARKMLKKGKLASKTGAALRDFSKVVPVKKTAKKVARTLTKTVKAVGSKIASRKADSGSTKQRTKRTNSKSSTKSSRTHSAKKSR